MAADNQLVTSVAAIYEYNDNIRLDFSDELSDSIYTVAPKLKLVRRHEKYTARADAILEFYRYQDLDAFDDTDQWYNGFIEATPTERWQIGAEAHLSDDNRPDRDIEETGLVLNNVRRKRINAGTSAFYTFSEMVAGGLVLEFNRENFDDPGNIRPQGLPCRPGPDPKSRCLAGPHHRSPQPGLQPLRVRTGVRTDRLPGLFRCDHQRG